MGLSSGLSHTMTDDPTTTTDDTPSAEDGAEITQTDVAAIVEEMGLPNLSEGAPDELLEAVHGSRTFLVRRDQYLDTAVAVSKMKKSEQLGYLIDHFEEKMPPPVVGLYEWAGENPVNVPFVGTVGALGLQQRLGSSRDNGRIMGSTATPIVYCKASVVMSKKDFQKAAAAAVRDQYAHGNKRVARILEDMTGLTDAFKRTFVTLFLEDAEDVADENRRIIVGCFVYQEPREKLRGPVALIMPPDAIRARFAGLQTDQGKLIGFDLSGSILLHVGNAGRHIMTDHRETMEKVAGHVAAFDEEQLPEITLVPEGDLPAGMVEGWTLPENQGQAIFPDGPMVLEGDPDTGVLNVTVPEGLVLDDAHERLDFDNVNLSPEEIVGDDTNS